MEDVLIAVGAAGFNAHNGEEEDGEYLNELHFVVVEAIAQKV